MIFYKVLNEDGSARIGRGKWYLPQRGRPGKWMPQIKGALIICQSGYHLCRRADLLNWLGPVIYQAEPGGEIIKATDKIVARQARLLRRLDNWTERTARLFACDCAERVLPFFERGYPTDTRPREAIETARRFAAGQAAQRELAAAGDAAGDAARAAERKWQTKRLFQYLNGETL